MTSTAGRFETLQLKPVLATLIGPAARQVQFSLGLLNGEELSENQRFHLRQIEQVLCSEPPLEEDL